MWFLWMWFLWSVPHEDYSKPSAIPLCLYWLAKKDIPTSWVVITPFLEDVE